MARTSKCYSHLDLDKENRVRGLSLRDSMLQSWPAE